LTLTLKIKAANSEAAKSHRLPAIIALLTRPSLTAAQSKNEAPQRAPSQQFGYRARTEGYGSQ